MRGKAKRCLRFEHIVVAARTEDARAGASAAAAVQQNCTVGDVAPQDAGAREEKSGSQVSVSSSSPVMCAQVPPDLVEMEAMLAAGSVDGAGEFVAKENQTPRTIAKTLGICAQELVQLNQAAWPTLKVGSKLKHGTRLRLPAESGPSTLGGARAGAAQEKRRRGAAKKTKQETPVKAAAVNGSETEDDDEGCASAVQGARGDAVSDEVSAGCSSSGREGAGPTAASRTGRLQRRCGLMYEGEVQVRGKKEVMHGKGVYTNLMHYESLDAVGTNGFLWKKYEGDFENDKMTGQGTIFWADGSVFFGRVCKNQPREGVYIEDGQRFDVTFSTTCDSLISGHKPQPKTKKPCADIPKQAVNFDEEKSLAEGVGRHVLPLEAAAEQRSTQCANDCEGADSAAAKWCRECEKAICSTCARACSTNLHHVLVDICNSTAVIPSHLPKNVEEDKGGEMVGRGRGDPDDGSENPWLEGNEELQSGGDACDGGHDPLLDSRLEEQDQEGGEQKIEEHVETDEARKQRKQERKKIRKEERARRKEEEAERERLERRQLKAEARAKAKEEKRLFAMRKREEAAEKLAAAQKLEEEARMIMAEEEGEEGRARAGEPGHHATVRSEQEAAAFQDVDDEVETNDLAKSTSIAEGGARGRSLAGKWSNVSLDNQQQAISKKNGGEDGVVAAAGRGVCTTAPAGGSRGKKAASGKSGGIAKKRKGSGSDEIDDSKEAISEQHGLPAAKRRKGVGIADASDTHRDRGVEIVKDSLPPLLSLEQDAKTRVKRPTLLDLMEAGLISEGDRVVCKGVVGVLKQGAAIKVSKKTTNKRIRGTIANSVSEFSRLCGATASVSGWRFVETLDTRRCLQDLREDYLQALHDATTGETSPFCEGNNSSSCREGGSDGGKGEPLLLVKRWCNSKACEWYSVAQEVPGSRKQCGFCGKRLTKSAGP